MSWVRNPSIYRVSSPPLLSGRRVPIVIFESLGPSDSVTTYQIDFGKILRTIGFDARESGFGEEKEDGRNTRNAQEVTQPSTTLAQAT